MADKVRIAFLGVGLMGAPMAARLAVAGFDVRVWNRSPEKAESLRDRAVLPCATPAEACAGAAIVCLCLTDAAAVRAVMLEAGGAAGALSSETVVIDFSTIGVAAARDISEQVRRRYGARWLDAPVSGGVAGATAGTLVIFAGGDADVLERAQPALAHVSSRVTHFGDVGAGQAAKLCNQLIVASNLAAIAEAIALGERLGVDVAKLPAALQGGFADSKPLQIFGPRMAVATDPGPAVSELRTMHKDVLAVIAAAADAGAPVALIKHVEHLYRKIADAGLGGHDLPVLMRNYREER